MYLAPIAGVASVAAMSWAVRGRSSSVFGPSVWRGDPGRPALALTFDDGPSEATPRILEILEQYRVPATFFQVGKNVERLPAIARAVQAAGHSIGNHTHTHRMLCFRSPQFMRQDLQQAQRAIQEHTGVTPEWFRAPFGVRWFGLGGAQRSLQLTGVMWTAIGYDWSRKSDAVFAQLARRVQNGAIFCLHDGRELNVKPDVSATVEAIRRLVPALLDRGYKFETVSQVLCPTT